MVCRVADGRRHGALFVAPPFSQICLIAKISLPSPTGLNPKTLLVRALAAEPPRFRPSVPAPPREEASAAAGAAASGVMAHRGKILQKDPVKYMQTQADMGMGPVSYENCSVFKKGEGSPEAPGALRLRNKKATASVASSYSRNPPVRPS